MPHTHIERVRRCSPEYNVFTTLYLTRGGREREFIENQV